MTNPTAPTKSEIFTAYNQARAIARRAGDLKQIERLNKALGILMSKNYYATEKSAYAPTFYTCGCKDWQYKNAARRAYTGPCKHMLADALLQDILMRRADHDVTAEVSLYIRHYSTIQEG
jgi:hypothetical protein